MTKLAEDRELMLEQMQRLRNEIEERDRRARDLEAELGESRRRRADAVKRIDGLISRLDEIESEVIAAPHPTAAARGK